jgi:hypothetical protein
MIEHPRAQRGDHALTAPRREIALAVAGQIADDLREKDQPAHDPECAPVDARRNRPVLIMDHPRHQQARQLQQHGRGDAGDHAHEHRQRYPAEIRPSLTENALQDLRAFHRFALCVPSRETFAPVARYVR